MANPYCVPHNASLSSETWAVCRRIARLLTAISDEVNNYVCDGEILDDIRAFRRQMIGRLEAEGWTMSYVGGKHLKVLPPGHKKPFPKHG